MSWAAAGSVAGGRTAPAGSSSSLLLLRRRQQQLQQQGRAWGVDGEEAGDEGLDLFSKERRSIPFAGGGESEGQNVPPNLGRISVGSAKLVRSGMDDLLSAADMGKHDYDWLLTPPGSPLSSLDMRESHLSSVHPAPGNNLTARSVSTTRTSRLSVAQSENNHSTRPARSSSVTRPSVSNIYASSNSNRTSDLNTSTMSVTSSRPSTPNRSMTLSSTRQSASTLPRPTTSRSSTPSKIRPTSSFSGHGSRPSSPTPRSQNAATVTRSSSRPSTPTRRAPVQTSAQVATLSLTSSLTIARSSSRPSTPTRRASAQTSAPVATLNSSSTVSRSSSRPSTPTHRAPVQTSAIAAAHSHSVARNVATNGRSSAPPSRPSSPGPRVRAPSQPPLLPDFPLDAPPNLRTKIPERPASAGRARTGLPLTVRANSNPETVPPVNLNGRRPSSPISTRGRPPDNSPKLRSQGNGYETHPPEIQKPMQQENVVRRPVKTTTTMESTGFGRTISKTSLDMALRHMDIRQGMGGIRGASLFPQSIRSTAPKTRHARMSDPIIPVSSNGTDTEDNSCNGMISTSCSSAASENGDIEVRSLGKTVFVGRTSDPDIYESSRYDTLLLKEDSRSLNWLHSIEDKSDQSSVFDHSFEPLPEPFVLQ